MQGLSQADAAYQNAVVYAKDRIQGRAVTGVEAPEKAADPLIVHPDVRRALLDQKSFVEGARRLRRSVCPSARRSPASSESRPRFRLP